MLIKTENPQLGTTVIIARQPTKERLAAKCFRNEPYNRAGNFSQWRTIYALFGDQDILQSLLLDASDAFTEGQMENSICIDFKSPVGWSSTDDLEKYRPEDLEQFKPNWKSSALRVKPSLGDRLPAPQTNFVTIIYEIREESGQIAIIIHSAYPGKDIGELVDNISERENCVFFDWGHLGVL